jgi:hypothetical protein
MSKLRNTTRALWYGRRTIVTSAVVAGSLAASLLAACSSDAPNPTAPTSRSAPAYASAPAPGSAPDNAWDSQKHYNSSQFAASAPTWHTSDGDHQPGTRVPEGMTCGGATATSATVSATVRPSTATQTVQLGRNAVLTVPAGAVTSAVTITATATVGDGGITVDFQPHGYQFAKAIILSANYQGCTMRYSSPLNVFYLNDQGGIIQTMPSNDMRSSNTIQALTDHFSRYMIAWS